jgi:Inorganic pyrophosphatase
MHTSDYLGQRVTVVIDRPKGSHHPEWGFLYEASYGFIPKTLSADGEELDAYFLGEVPSFSDAVGVCIAVIFRSDDDDKLVVVPDGVTLTEAEIVAATRFQERFFTSRMLFWFSPNDCSSGP